MSKECQTDIDECKITKWNESSGNRADWEKCIEQGKVRNGQTAVPSKAKLDLSIVESTVRSVEHCAVF